MTGIYEAVGTAGISVREALARENDLAKLSDDLIREKVIRQAMAETGESREIVIEMLDAAESMGQEAVLDLTEGQPTTLHNGLSRYVESLLSRWPDGADLDQETVVGELSGLLAYPWPADRPGVPVDLEDSLERREGEPVGYHRRRTTETGYPLMGSSDAEREESHQRAIRIQRQAMRDHVFVGDGQYCEAMLPTCPSGSPETGVITGATGCGYGRDTHPDAV